MDLHQLLKHNNIHYDYFEHEAVFTCDEANQLGLNMPGAKTKNLFLRDGKGRRHWLLVASDDTQLELSSLALQLGVRRLSFASPERLARHLGSEAGRVSLLDILKADTDTVSLLIEDQVWQSNAIQCHPYTNSATMVIETDGLKQLFCQRNIPVTTIELTTD